MKVPARSFSIEQAVRAAVPLNIGIVGQQGSGKTMSAIRLAVGEQRVVGGSICFIDTEAGRGKAFAPKRGEQANPSGNPPTYAYDHMLFLPPYGPLDYLAAIRAAVAHGARVIIVDSMTHEHYGLGGVMWQSEDYIEKRIERERSRGDLKEWEIDKLRGKYFKNSLVAPKMQRRVLNMEIERLGVNGIFCYRGRDKLKWGAGEPTDMGIRPETTTDLAYQMTVNFLLHEMAEGRPSFSPENEFERDWFKLPIQFRGWFPEGTQLNEALGERMALWARGDGAGERDGLLADVKRLALVIHPDDQAGGKAARGSLLREIFAAKLADIERLPEDRLREGVEQLKARAAFLYPVGGEENALPSEDEMVERQDVREPFGSEARSNGARLLQPDRIEYLARQAAQIAGGEEGGKRLLARAAECFHSSGDLSKVPASMETEILRELRRLAAEEQKKAKAEAP